MAKDYLNDFGLVSSDKFETQEPDSYNEALNKKDDIGDEMIKKIIVDVQKNEKDALLKDKNEDENDISMLIFGLGILLLILLLFVPKIYLSNNIYYASKNINSLRAEQEALMDENAELQRKLESAKFNSLTYEMDVIE